MSSGGDESVARPTVYLAGPEVFLPREEALRIADAKKAICTELGLTGLFPFDLDPEIEASEARGEPLARAIARKDEGLVRSADAVVANVSPFRSPSADVGTVYEVGYARGLGKPIFGYTNAAESYSVRCGAEPGATDADGLAVEDMGCFDNLMLHGAFATGGDGSGDGVVVATATSAGGPAGLLTDLDNFRVAVARAADHLLGAKGDGAVVDAPGTDEWIPFMREAIAESVAAEKEGNHPFGAVLVSGSGEDMEIIARGRNAVVTDNDCTRHAELVLVAAASQQFDRTTLGGATLVTSTAPCPMCSGAIYWAGIGRVVYGCPAKTLGDISGEELDVDCRDVLSAGVLHSVDVVGPVLGEEAAAQHRDFWPRFIAAGNEVV